MKRASFQIKQDSFLYVRGFPREDPSKDLLLSVCVFGRDTEVIVVRGARGATWFRREGKRV